MYSVRSLLVMSKKQLTLSINRLDFRAIAQRVIPEALDYRKKEELPCDELLSDIPCYIIRAVCLVWAVVD